jgi:uncharacterized membrane protein
MIKIDKRIKYTAIILLLLAGLVGSILTLSENSAFCIADEEKTGCSAVQSTPYAYTLGIKNGYYGIAFFSILIILALSQVYQTRELTKKLFQIGIISGVIIAIYFLYLQAFVIRDFCTPCLIVDFSIIFVLGIQFIFKEK